MRKLPMLMLGMFLGIGALMGCRSRDPLPEGDGKTRLRLWAMPNTAGPKDVLDQILERFRQQNPNIEVEVEIIDWGAAWGKITTAVSSGAGADVFQLGTTWTSSVTAMGGLLPLDGLLQRLGGDSIFVSSARSYMKPIYADSLTSFPWFVDVRPMFYRTDVLAKADIRPEEMFATWDSYLVGLRKIKSAKITLEGQRVEPLGIAGKDWNVFHNFYPWIVGNGGGIINDLGDSVLLDDEKSIQGVLAYLRFFREGLAPRAYLEKGAAQVSREFDEGRIAVWQETSSKLVYLERPLREGGENSPGARHFAAVLPPAGPAGRKLFLGGSNLAIFKSTRNREAAEKLLAFLTTDSAAVLAFCKISGFAPALEKTFQDPYYRENPNRVLFRDLVVSSKPYPAVPYWGDIETAILNKHFGNILDIASGSIQAKDSPKGKDGTFSEDAVRQELKIAAEQIRALIQREIQSNPANATRLARLRQVGR